MSEQAAKERKKNAFSEFFRENKSLKVLLPILVVGIIAIIILYSNPDGGAKPASSDLTSQDTNQTGLYGKTVEVLPQMERITDPGVSLAQVRDPFSSNVVVPVLKGITLSGEKNTAIVETENRAYVVCTGDIIGDAWTVEEIDASGVVLKGKDGNEITISFSK